LYRYTEAEGSMAELYGVAKQLEEDLSGARGEAAALRGEMKHMRSEHAAMKQRMATLQRETGGGGVEEEDAAAASATAGGDAGEGDEEEDIAETPMPAAATPVAPSTASPAFIDGKGGNRGHTFTSSVRGTHGHGGGKGGNKSSSSGSEQLRRAKEAATSGSMSAHRWAVDTPEVAAAAAAARGGAVQVESIDTYLASAWFQSFSL
jgi:hypothetical protein